MCALGCNYFRVAAILCAWEWASFIRVPPIIPMRAGMEIGSPTRTSGGSFIVELKALGIPEHLYSSHLALPVSVAQQRPFRL